MNAEQHRELRELLGAYVLDQLSSAEAISVQAHLDGCPGCRAEVEEIAPLVSALRHVDPDRVQSPPSPPAELGDRIVQTVREGRRSTDRRTLWQRGAAGLLVAAAVIGAFVFGTTRAQLPSSPPVVPLAVHLNAGGLQVDAGLVKHTWGTELKLQATGLENGGAYTVTFIRDDGSLVPGGTFLGTGAKTLTCSMNGALPLDEMVEVTITDAAGGLVLDAEPA